MSDIKVDFSIDPPPKEDLVRILQGVQWDAKDEAIDLMITHRPNPSLMAMWAMLMQEKKVVGFATLYLPPPQSLQTAPVFIGNFVIERVFHGSGRGSFLLLKIEQWCSQMQVKLLALQTLESSTPFFKSKGFDANLDHSEILFKSLV